MDDDTDDETQALLPRINPTGSTVSNWTFLSYAHANINSSMVAILDAVFSLALFAFATVLVTTEFSVHIPLLALMRTVLVVVRGPQLRVEAAQASICVAVVVFLSSPSVHALLLLLGATVTPSAIWLLRPCDSLSHDAPHPELDAPTNATTTTRIASDGPFNPFPTFNQLPATPVSLDDTPTDSTIVFLFPDLLAPDLNSPQQTYREYPAIIPEAKEMLTPLFGKTAAFSSSAPNPSFMNKRLDSDPVTVAGPNGPNDSQADHETHNPSVYPVLGRNHTNDPFSSTSMVTSPGLSSTPTGGATVFNMKSHNQVSNVRPPIQHRATDTTMEDSFLGDIAPNGFSVRKKEQLAFQRLANDAFPNEASCVTEGETESRIKETSTDAYTRLGQTWLHSESVMSSINLMWNGDYDDAESLLLSKTNIAPSTPSARVSLHLAELFMLIQLSSGCEDDISNALKSIKSAEIVCGNLLQHSSELRALFSSLPSIFEHEKALQDSLFELYQLDAECCFADTLLFKGVCQIFMGREIKGTSTLRASFRIYQKLTKRIEHLDITSTKPEIRHIYEREKSRVQDTVSFGTAFFDFVLEIVPYGLASILKALGFSSNRSSAIMTLTRISRSDSLRAPLAIFVLLFESASFTSAVGVLRMRKWASDPFSSAAAGFAMGDAGGGGPGSTPESFRTKSFRQSVPEDAFVANGRINETVVVGVKKVKKGMLLAQDALNRWQKSPVFNIMAYYIWRKVGLTDESSRFLNIAISSVSPSVVAYPVALWFEMACHLALRCDWQAARAIFETIWNTPANNASSQALISSLEGPGNTLSATSSFCNSTHSKPALGQQAGSSSSLFANDWFEVRPMAGICLVGCLRAGEGPLLKTGGASYETAKNVRKDILIALSSRRIKKTRIIKFSILLLEWAISRPGAIHPLLTHTILLLRRDLHRLCLQPATRTKDPLQQHAQLRLVYNLCASIHDLTAENCGMEDSSGRLLVLFLQAVLFKCWVLCARHVELGEVVRGDAAVDGYGGSLKLVLEGLDEITAWSREMFQTCIDFRGLAPHLQRNGGTGANTTEVLWIVAHARYELKELDVLLSENRWGTAVFDLMRRCFDDEGVLASEAVDKDTLEWRGKTREGEVSSSDEGEFADRLEDEDTAVTATEDVDSDAIYERAEAFRADLRKRTSNVSLGSVEVLEQDGPDLRLVAALHWMKLACLQ
ncbi:hypothetical protein BJ741DRAFT_647973 [Chytriomyces cf. hyalinus JEL632]|nr:hypothetical protein BJ741DRAFT_647973 [Chytriomyces cf. hyalinus JEL632]